MTRGTIALVGADGREIALLVARLQKEGYAVARLGPSAAIYGRVARLKPQAVLVTDCCRRATVDGLVARLAGEKTRPPLIILTNDRPAAALGWARGWGEVWPLHELSLAEVVGRLRFAIELTQLASA